MEKPEITEGMKQALERGYTLEQTKRSFINAGYSLEDVEDSASFLSTGSVLAPVHDQVPMRLSAMPTAPIQSQPSIQQPMAQPVFQPRVQPQFKPQMPSKPQIPSTPPNIQPSNRPFVPQINQQETVKWEKPKSRWVIKTIIISLGVVLLLLLGVLVMSIFNKDLLASWLSKIGIKLF